MRAGKRMKSRTRETQRGDKSTMKRESAMKKGKKVRMQKLREREEACGPRGETPSEIGREDRIGNKRKEEREH